MDLHHFDAKDIEKESKNNHSLGSFFSNFMQELSHSLEENKEQSQSIDDFKKQIEAIRKEQHTSSTTTLEEDTVYVVNGIENEEISVVNTVNGDSLDIYIATNENVRDDLHQKGIQDNIYSMSEDDFYRLELGSNLIFQDQILSPFEGEIEIENDIAWDKLEDLYFNLEQEEGRTYQVTDISDSKIILHDTENNGQYEIYRVLYPDWEIGDLIIRENKKYRKLEQ